MIIDLDKTRKQKDWIKSMLDTKHQDDRYEQIGILAICAPCPVIAVCYYIGELYGFTPELDQKIQRLVDFYHIEKVINCEDKRATEVRSICGGTNDISSSHTS